MDNSVLAHKVLQLTMCVLQNRRQHMGWRREGLLFGLRACVHVGVPVHVFVMGLGGWKQQSCGVHGQCGPEDQ